MSVLGVMNDPYFQQAMRTIQTHWFPKHVTHRHVYPEPSFKLLTETAMQNIECLEWRNPENSNYLVLYFRHGATLFVTGDIGQAVYRWTAGQDIDLAWIAHCNYSYFAEKIEGLNGSFEAKRWDSGMCERRMREFIKEHYSSDEQFAGWQSVLGTEHEWANFVNSDLVGLGYDALSWGFVPEIRCIGHWLGLRMALGIKTA